MINLYALKYTHLVSSLSAAGMAGDRRHFARHQVPVLRGFAPLILIVADTDVSARLNDAVKLPPQPSNKTAQ
jgi:hypothetical protein